MWCTGRGTRRLIQRLGYARLVFALRQLDYRQGFSNGMRHRGIGVVTRLDLTHRQRFGGRFRLGFILHWYVRSVVGPVPVMFLRYRAG